MLDGDNRYQCEKCNRKVNAMRRCCIEESPENLIIHLRRFEFDVELMRRNKVNEFCQFDHVLDLENYTKEGLERKEKKNYLNA